MRRTLGLVPAILLLVPVGLLLSACGVDADRARSDLDASRAPADALLEKVAGALSGAAGGTPETGRREWDLCSGSPSEALRYTVAASFKPRADATIDDLGAAAKAEGWTVTDVSPPNVDRTTTLELTRDGTDEQVMVHLDREFGPAARRDLASVSVAGPCVRVTDDQANDLVGVITD